MSRIAAPDGSYLTDANGLYLVDNAQVSSVIKTFAVVNGSFGAVKDIPVATDRVGLGRTGETIWSLGPTTTPMLHWTDPFTLTPLRNGRVAVYVSGVFTAVDLGVEHVPSAMAWRDDGTIWAATVENDLFEINISGEIVSQSVIPSNGPPDYVGQEDGVPLGISSMIWWTDGHLYAASAFNGCLIKVL